MNWLVFVFIAAAFAAMINHLDKYLITTYLKGGSIGSLAIFSAMMGLPTFLIIGIFHPEVRLIEARQAFFIVLNGILYVSWLFPYFYALEIDEASVVTPLFQLAAVFSYIIGFVVLGEIMTELQWIGSLLIVMGSLGLSLEMVPGQKIFLKKKVLMLMGLASLLVATNGVLFKSFAIEQGFWTVAFWEYMGFFVTAMLLFIFIPSFRAEFLKVLKKNKLSILSVNLVNEIFAVVAKLSLNFATLLAPVALVMFVGEGFQPFFVLGIGVLLTIYFPKLSSERIEKRYLGQKIISIIVMFAGTFLLISK